jgi:LytS/YehU family sensor histidine kinase
VLLIGSIKLRRFSQEKERRAQELETQLTSARLQTLQLQLQPHFLFNTLNTLASLVHTDPAKAEEVLLCLSNLLRATLETKDKNLIPFRQELQLVRSYLTVQRARYGERLTVVEDIPLETLICSVPPLLLLPVLENAIKHAVEPNPERTTIGLRCERTDDKLIVLVEDSGAGRSSHAPSGHGIGVANTRDRLSAAYPGRPVGFELLPNHSGGITARFEMPAIALLPSRENS